LQSNFKYRIFFFCLFCFAFIGCDRATKNLAKVHLMAQEPLSFLHNTIRFEYVENTGAFLSFGDSWPKTISFWVFSILPLVFLSVIFMYAVKKSKELSVLRLLPYALIVSGGVGNIIDRILFDRHVVDFMNIGINNLRTGIFNFADVYITAGVFMLFLFRTKKLNEPEM